jgi:hypothetical protein
MDARRAEQIGRDPAGVRGTPASKRLLRIKVRLTSRAKDLVVDEVPLPCADSDTLSERFKCIKIAVGTAIDSVAQTFGIKRFGAGDTKTEAAF